MKNRMISLTLFITIISTVFTYTNMAYAEDVEIIIEEEDFQNNEVLIDEDFVIETEPTTENTAPIEEIVISEDDYCTHEAFPIERTEEILDCDRLSLVYDGDCDKYNMDGCAYCNQFFDDTNYPYNSTYGGPEMPSRFQLDDKYVSSFKLQGEQECFVYALAAVCETALLKQGVVDPDIDEYSIHGSEVEYKFNYTSFMDQNNPSRCLAILDQCVYLHPHKQKNLIKKYVMDENNYGAMRMAGYHATQIIGWDDNLQFKYCGRDYTGAWILKDSSASYADPFEPGINYRPYDIAGFHAPTGTGNYEDIWIFGFTPVED